MKNKKKILVVNYNMIVGGSTTSLINFLSFINKEKYEIDILLYRNEGELLDYLPSDVTLLDQACKYGRRKKLSKICKSFFKGYLIKAAYTNKKLGQKGLSSQVMADCQAKEFSRKLDKHYDIAIGYLEGWADRYVAYNVKADKKYGWLHSTFSKIAPFPSYELSWMRQMEKVICVADSCRIDMIDQIPEISGKSITIENMVDRNFIRRRACDIDYSDSYYKMFLNYSGVKIATVCRLSIETKGLDRIVKCADVLKKQGYDFMWMIVGDGKDKNSIMNLIIEKQLDDFIFLAGSRTNPYPIMSKSDFICMPSRWEGKPMTVLEAKALGIPCLVTRYLSASEQIEDGKNGWIVDNTDDAIIPAIERLILNRDCIVSAKKYMEEKLFTNSEYIKKIEEMLLN